MKDRNAERSTQNSKRTLVIGYGNELRGDDAVGPQLARSIAGWRLLQVDTLVVHQLMPELAADLARVERAIFVDAYRAEAGDAKIGVIELTGVPFRDLVWHTSEPGALLALTSTVYGRAPRAWSVSVPAIRFDYGAQLSSLTQSGADMALTIIRDLINSCEAQRNLHH